ncbi:MAG: TonB-dependent receptor [Cytophagales bacterium]|nr:TonB-dependent receptor [Cytophagales bacterium]
MKSRVLYGGVSLFGALLLSLSALAQYSISGKVIDSDTQEPLIGATVVLKGTTRGSITDLEGDFAVGGIADEEATLIVTFIGYEDQELKLQFNGQDVRNKVVSMKESTSQMQEVEVRGIIEGQIAAMATMKSAENIKNVVSSEQILTFPDMNAAEVMQRIPGVTLQRDQGDGRFVQIRGTPPALTNFNINGEQLPSPEGKYRFVGMDIIPSDQIESIEVSKVMTPDMDGDAIGGSVNVITKEAKDGTPQMSGALGYGHTFLRGNPMYNAQFSYGSRLNKIGFQLNASYIQNNQGSDNIEYKYTKGPFLVSRGQRDSASNYNLHFREIQLRHYDIIRTRIAISPSLDYKFNPHHKIYLKGIFNNFTDEEIRRRKVYGLDDPFNGTKFLYGDIAHDTRERTKVQTLNAISLGGEHNLGLAKVDYQIFYSTAGESVPDGLYASFENSGQAVTIDVDTSNVLYPRIHVIDTTTTQKAFDYSTYEMDELQFYNSQVREQLITPRINIEIPYDFGFGHSGYVKFGGKVRMRTKSASVISDVLAYNPRAAGRIYTGTAPDLRLTTVSDGFQNANLLNQGYLLDGMPSPDRMRDFYEDNSWFFVKKRDDTRNSTLEDDYEYAENIYAAYAMVRHNIGKLMLIAGLRYELTDVTKNKGYRILYDSITNRYDTTISINQFKDQFFWLPNFQIKYSLDAYTNIRAAYSTGYTRASYGDIVPRRTEEKDETSYGNPQLNFASSTNIDLMIERYRKRDILSAGVFYKQIENFNYTYNSYVRFGPGGSGNFPIYETQIPLNGTTANLYGLELQAQLKFDFLPSFLKDFGLYSNYTYTYSEAYIPKRNPGNFDQALIVDRSLQDLDKLFLSQQSERIPFPGQATHTANLALFYDHPFFFVRATANFQDDFLVSLGVDPDLDQYYAANLRYDLTLNIKPSSQFTIFMDWINIGNTPLRIYSGNENVIKQNEFYSMWLRGGIRMNL